jgi:hypothetical protein
MVNTLISKFRGGSMLLSSDVVSFKANFVTEASLEVRLHLGKRNVIVRSLGA